MSNRAHARRTDRETSHLAAEAVTPGLTAIQREVDAFARRYPNGFLDLELVEAFPDLGASTLRTRRSELLARNIILDSMRRERPEGAASPHTIWIHRQFVENPPDVCEPPSPAAIAATRAEALKAAEETDRAAHGFRLEGRAPYAEQLTAHADLFRRLAGLVA